MRGWLWNIGMTFPMALASCGGSSTDPRAPSAIEQLMQANFPADGQVHLLKAQGRFVIEPKTEVCAITQGFMVNSQKLFGAIGQTWVSEAGGDRQRPATDPECKKQQTVYIFSIKSDNRQGKPYKLVLAAWQGDPAKGGAVWVGGLERNLDPSNADTWGEMPWRMGKARIEDAINPTIDLISEKFVQFITVKAKQ